MLGLGPFDGDGFLQDKTRTQVLGAHILVRGKGFRRTLLEDGAFIKEIGTVGDRKRLTDIVVCDDDTDVLVLELGDDELDVLHGDRIHAGERLIQKNEFRINGQGPGDLAAAALASGKLYAKTLADLREIELVDKILKPLLPFGLRHVRHLHHRHDVVLH